MLLKPLLLSALTILPSIATISSSDQSPLIVQDPDPHLQPQPHRFDSSSSFASSSSSSSVSASPQAPPTMLTKSAAPVIHDALIIGAGPAGLSAALSLARVCRTSAVFDSREFRNRGAEAMHGFLSRDGIRPEDFRATARAQISDKYSDQVSFFNTKIVKVANTEILPGYKGFEAVDSANVTYRGRKLVLATGTQDLLPTDIEGYADNWPSHIYQCPFCDGYEQKAHPIGMLTFPNPSYLHFALMALPFNKDLTIFSNGPVPADEPTQAALKKAMAAGAKLDDRKVKRLVNNGPGPEKGITVEFESGPSAKLGMLLHRPPTKSRASDLIEQLGLETKPNGDVVADAMMLQTNVPGCIVAGDTYESIKQALMASSNGLRAAAVCAFQLASEEGDRALAAQEEAQREAANL